MSEKRMISDTGYEVKRSQWIGGTEYLMAENPKAHADERFMVCDYTQNAFLGQYANAVVDGNGMEAISEYNKRVYEALDKVSAELDSRGLPSELFTAEHCIPHSYEQDINGKVVAIKADCLSPEYRRGSEQFVYVTGGFGANANSRGNAVYCYQLSDKKQVRFERYQVLGIVKELPDWAKDCLTAVKEQIAAKHEKSNKERDDAR